MLSGGFRLSQPYHYICGTMGIPGALLYPEHSLFFCQYLQILILTKLCTSCMLGYLQYWICSSFFLFDLVLADFVCTFISWLVKV